MDKELVSAIITTHNRPPEMVLRAVNSVLNQTYEHIEIIVVDDSDKNFPKREDVEKVIHKASDKILYIKHDICKGACAARNTGLSYAKGYYIAFLDDDDEWFPEKTELQLKGFSDKDIALVYCGMLQVDELRKLQYIQHIRYIKGNVFNELLKHSFIGGTSNPLIKRDCIEEIGGFDEKMQSKQDYDLWVRIAMRYPVNYVDKPLLKYHMHDDKRISTDIDRQIKGTERFISKYREHIEKDNKTWCIKHRVLGRLYVKKGMRKEAFTLWLECIKRAPFSILMNTKLLLLILFGFDSLLYRMHHWLMQDRGQKIIL